MNEQKINVFISWSGERAEAVAKVLYDWIEVGLQFTQPYLSKHIGAGELWLNDVTKYLEESNFGILVLTRENVNSNWILFEAGALSKKLGAAKVIPCLIDLDYGDLSFPLAMFQSKKLPSEFWDVVKAINNSQPDPWDEKKLEKTYYSFKDKFDEELTKALIKFSSKANAKKSIRSSDEKLEEVLQIVRTLTKGNEDDYSVNEQFYPTDDRIQLYKFLKNKVKLPLYKNASMPALFEAAAKYINYIKPKLSDDESLLEVARYLISERPLKNLLDALEKYEKQSKKIEKNEN